MNCIILGDKHSKGMKSRGCPALIPYGKKKNLFQHQKETLRSIFGDELRLIYIHGFDSKKFVEFLEYDYDNSIVSIYNSNYASCGVAGSLSKAAHLFDQKSLIINGYKEINKKHIKKIDMQDSCSQIVLAKSDGSSYDKPGGLIIDGYIKNFGFDLQNRLEEIYYLNKECCIFLQSILSNAKYSNCFLFELLNKTINSGLSLKPIFI